MERRPTSLRCRTPPALVGALLQQASIRRWEHLQKQVVPKKSRATFQIDSWLSCAVKIDHSIDCSRTKETNKWNPSLNLFAIHLPAAFYFYFHWCYWLWCWTKPTSCWERFQLHWPGYYPISFLDLTEVVYWPYYFLLYCVLSVACFSGQPM